MKNNLSEIWRTAREFGKVRVFTMDDGCSHCCIIFNTVQHTKLEAQSSFVCATPEDAVQEAIVAARGIVDSILKLRSSIPERKLLNDK